MKRVLLFFLLSAFIFTKSYSQAAYAKGQMKEDFYSAEMYVLYEEYKEALPLYLDLLKINPINNNYKYRIGQCLVNIEGRKKEAIKYLEAAVRDINPRYKEGKFKETRAPYDSYYYLANAYRIDNQLDRALSTYELFRQNLDPKVYDTAVVNLQIESCRNAKELMKAPMYVKRVNMGEVFNSQYPEQNPVVSGDQKVIVFNRISPLQIDILYTRNIDGKWTAPINLIPDLGLGMEKGNYATGLSYDGRELYIYRAGADFDGNIYVTKRTGDDKWSNLKKLNDNINTKYWESHASVSHDGKKLYFTSNRKDSYGGLDIYVSERDSADAWGPAKNLGAVINTPYNEESPFTGKDDKTLFFSSRGHFNIGGYDIYYSSLMDNGQWSSPLNMGYPVNTTDEDVFFSPIGDGYQAYYSLIDTGGYGQLDIYRIEVFSKDHPRKFLVKGIVRVKDLIALFGEKVKVSALSLEDPNAEVIVYSDPSTGEYKFELPQGKYSITYEASGAETAVKNIDLPLTFPADSFVIPGTTLAKTDFTAELYVGDKKTISVENGDTISIPVKVEPNSILIVEHWLGDKLLYTDKYILKEPDFILKVAPRTGTNRIVFNLTDKFNNTTSSEILIIREKKITKQPVVRPEYKSVIAQKQMDAFIEMNKKQADDKIRQVIEKSGIEKQKFGKVDEIVTYIKEEAARNGIPASEIDKLELRVAVMENVLTQAAVDLLAANTDCDLHDLLKNLNIYETDLKTWTDLQKYIEEKSNGKIKPEELNKQAADVLNDMDTRIRKVREQILTYSSKSDIGSVLIEAVTGTDKLDIRKSGLWLKNVYNEALNAGASVKDLSKMLTVLTSLPGTDVRSYLGDLSGFADEKFASVLGNLSDSKFRTCNDVVLYLLKNMNKGEYSDEELFTAVARTITCKDISDEAISAGLTAEEGKTSLTALWIALGALLIFFVIIIFRRRKKDKKENGES
jgi:tetratricopeptide (TPR) repeat protein